MLLRSRRVVVAAALLSALASGCANSERGYPSREVEGVSGIAVASAQLHIDLRPLAE